LSIINNGKNVYSKAFKFLEQIQKNLFFFNVLTVVIDCVLRAQSITALRTFFISARDKKRNERLSAAHHLKIFN